MRHATVIGRSTLEGWRPSTGPREHIHVLLHGRPRAAKLKRSPIRYDEPAGTVLQTCRSDATGRGTSVISYYCIVNMPGVPVREIEAFRSVDDSDARAEMQRLADRWPAYETVVLYHGERWIAVLANPALGFASEPLGVWERAA